MRIAILALFAGSLVAQTTATVTAVPKGGTAAQGKSYQFTLRPKTFVSSLTCTLVEIEPGESSLCTLNLNQLARAGGIAIDLTLPAGFTGPSTVSVGAGLNITTFTVTRTDTPAASLHLLYPDEVDWANVSPNAILPASNGARRDGIDLRLLYLPERAVESWRDTAKMAIPASYRIVLDEYDRHPILLTCFRAGGCGSTGVPWFTSSVVRLYSAR